MTCTYVFPDGHPCCRQARHTTDHMRNPNRVVDTKPTFTDCGGDTCGGERGSKCDACMAADKACDAGTCDCAPAVEPEHPDESNSRAVTPAAPGDAATNPMEFFATLDRTDPKHAEAWAIHQVGRAEERARIVGIIEQYIDESPDDMQILSYLYNEIVSGSKYGSHDA